LKIFWSYKLWSFETSKDHHTNGHCFWYLFLSGIEPHFSVKFPFLGGFNCSCSLYLKLRNILFLNLHVIIIIIHPRLSLVGLLWVIFRGNLNRQSLSWASKGSSLTTGPDFWLAANWSDFCCFQGVMYSETTPKHQTQTSCINWKYGHILKWHEIFLRVESHKTGSQGLHVTLEIHVNDLFLKRNN
jgi:hypothetical protein